MIEIVKSSEFNVRVMKDTDFDKDILGYNFSYPVLNTIDICNLFISGGTTNIQIERMGVSEWSFDKATATLSVKQKDDVKTHKI